MTANQRALAALIQQAAAAPRSEYQRVTARAKREHWEQVLRTQIAHRRIPQPVPQWHWHPTRAYSADLGWPEYRLIVEVDGGQWLGAHGGHTSGYGKERDCIRDCEAALQGITVLRVTPAMIEREDAITYIVRYMALQHLPRVS